MFGEQNAPSQPKFTKTSINISNPKTWREETEGMRGRRPDRGRLGRWMSYQNCIPPKKYFVNLEVSKKQKDIAVANCTLALANKIIK